MHLRARRSLGESDGLGVLYIEYWKEEVHVQMWLRYTLLYLQQAADI